MVVGYLMKKASDQRRKRNITNKPAYVMRLSEDISASTAREENRFKRRKSRCSGM